MLTEAVLVSLAGGALGLAGGVALLQLLSGWQPIPDIPINVPVNPGAATYGAAFLLAMVSGVLFGLVPFRQVMRADPWEVIRTGAVRPGSHRHLTLRDILLAAQIAICAVLVTSSLVAVRGLVRSLHGNFGFVPQSVMLVETDLNLAGYTEDRLPQMQQRMLDAAAAIPGVTSVGFTSALPLTLSGGDSGVFAESATDFRPGNEVADAMNYNISPGYIKTAGTRLLVGRDLTRQDDGNAPKVALVNRRFALKVFGSVEKAIGGHFKFWSGQRAEVVGVVEDGKYRALTEDPWPAMFFSFQQQHASDTWLLVRSSRNPEETSKALQPALRQLDPGLPFTVRTWNEEMSTALFASRVATVALGVLGLLGAMLVVTGIFGMASYTVSKRLREIGIRMALGSKRKGVLRAALGRVFVLLSVGSVTGLALGLLTTKVLSNIVYQAGPRDPLVSCGVVLTMLALGLVAAWIPAQRALTVEPVILLREE
jgi:predicted permease